MLFQAVKKLIPAPIKDAVRYGPAYAWQSRRNGYQLVQPRNQRFKIWLDAGEHELMRHRVLGIYEREKAAWVQSVCSPGVLFVDIGVNKGYFSLMAASLGAQVISCEPEPRNYEWIRKSIEANGYPIDLRQVAVSDKPGTLELSIGETSGSHSIVETNVMRAGGSVRVTAAPLDAILEGRRPDFIKIDVEGAEAAVIRGAQESLSHAKAIAVDLHPQYGVDVAAVTRSLQELGFTISELSGPLDLLGERK